MKGILPGWLLAVASVTPQVNAQVVYKCVDASGSVSYQSQACPQGAATTRSWDSEPPKAFGPERIAADRDIAKTSRQLQQRNRLNSARRSTGSAPARAPKQTACEAARTHRRSTLAKVGLKRDFDLLRKLDDQVAAACK